MAGDEGKKVNGDDGSLEQIEGVWEDVQCLRAYVDHPRKVPRQVSEEETAAAFVYKMDKMGPTADEVKVRVEIRRGHALRVIGRGDKTVKVELQRNSEMMVREATASMSPDGVLTIVIPKRQRPRKWYEFTDLVLLWFKMVPVGISS